MRNYPFPNTGHVDEPARALDGEWTWTAIVELTYQSGSRHVKGGEIQFPIRFMAPPRVSFELVTSIGASLMRWYSVKINELGDFTQLAVEAQTIFGDIATGQHFLVATVTGLPAANSDT